MPNFKACIFDLDGVIVDTAHYHFLAWKRLAAEWDIELTIDYNERLKGVSRMDSLDVILSLGNKSLSALEKEEAAIKKNTWYLEYISNLTSEDALPNVVQFITDLKHRGMLLAIGSSSKNARPILERLCLTDMFDAIVDGNDLTHAKPHPEVFLKAAKLLKQSPSDCVVFEDAQSGIKAANSAGMSCVGIGSLQHLHEADVVIPTLEDFNAETLQNVFATVANKR